MTSLHGNVQTDKNAIMGVHFFFSMKYGNKEAEI